MSASPYKFLAPYLLEDKDLFFGRSRETQLLLADIVINRLVVLFAKTGTGKTSLINAGVRPRLHERDYETFFIRVRKDPTVSVDVELAEYNLEGKTLSARLESLSEKLNKSIVLFFDQFEEFFIHVGGNSEAGRLFIKEIGALHKREESGVHIVFSMREEFLYEMDHFRSEIPAIFHNDSTLRLRGFEREQAAEAITGPANHLDYKVDPRLVTRLIDDLLDNSSHTGIEAKEIEPTQLQVVCDTIWQNRTGTSLSLDDYLKLGVDDKSNITQQILDRRLENELTRIENDDELKLLDRLLPLLRTEENTKNVRDLSGLIETLQVPQDLLLDLLESLKRSRLIQESGKGDALLVELTHDYLADGERISFLQNSVRRIWLDRIQKRNQVVAATDLENIAKNWSDLEPNQEQADFLFRSALAQNWDLRRWFDQAERHGVDVWNILKEKIESGNDDEAANAVELLKELPNTKAIQLLGIATVRKAAGKLALQALRISTESRNPEIAIEALKVLDEISKSVPDFTESPDEGLHAKVASPRPLQMPPYRKIRDLLYEGKVVPFLGAGASAGVRWPIVFGREGPYQSMPSSRDLARYLAAKVNFPFAPNDLARVSQYVTIVAGRRFLNEELHAIFNRDYAPAKLHNFLASVPCPLLIVTTNYDDLIESAFKAQGRPYDVVTNSTREDDLRDAVLWWQHTQSEPISVPPNKLYIDLDKVTVIYKLNGSIQRDAPERETFVITEDDYVDFLGQMVRNRAIPAVFAQQIVRSRHLFLGYDLREWTLRALLRRYGQLLRRSIGRESWAIQEKATTFSTLDWEALGIEAFDMAIEEFIEELEKS